MNNLFTDGFNLDFWQPGEIDAAIVTPSQMYLEMKAKLRTQSAAAAWEQHKHYSSCLFLVLFLISHIVDGPQFPLGLNLSVKLNLNINDTGGTTNYSFSSYRQKRA